MCETLTESGVGGKDPADNGLLLGHAALLTPRGTNHTCQSLTNMIRTITHVCSALPPFRTVWGSTMTHNTTVNFTKGHILYKKLVALVSRQQYASQDVDISFLFFFCKCHFLERECNTTLWCHKEHWWLSDMPPRPGESNPSQVSVPPSEVTSQPPYYVSFQTCWR